MLRRPCDLASSPFTSIEAFAAEEIVLTGTPMCGFRVLHDDASSEHGILETAASHPSQPQPGALDTWRPGAAAALGASVRDISLQPADVSARTKPFERGRTR